MKVLLSWLREFAPIDGDPEAIAEQLSDLGLAVEEMQILGGGLDGIVVARVLGLRPHPQADKIQLVDVDTGDGEDVDRAVDQRDDQDVAADPSAPRVSSVTGAAADVYLALWNRGQSADVVTAGDAAARWATTQRVRWS